MNGIRRYHLDFDRFFVFLLGAVYAILLIFIYWQVMPYENYFAKELYYSHNRSSWLIVSALFFSIVPITWIQKGLTRPTLVIYWLLYLFAYVPSLVVPIFCGLSLTIGEVLIIQIVYFTAFFMLGLIYKFPLIKFPGNIKNIKLTGMFLLLTAFLFSVVLMRATYFSGFQISIKDVYQLRYAFRDTASNSLMIVYFSSWLGNVIFPAIFSIGISRRNLFYSLVSLIGTVYVFSLTGQKSVLFMPLLILTFMLIIKRKNRSFGFYTLLGINALIILAVSLVYIIDSLDLFNLFVRRLIFAPGLATSLRFDYFLDNDKAKLGYSIFRKLVEYPYEYVPSRLIGIEYFNNPEQHSNANIFADGFTNFGVFGVYLVTLFLMVINYFIDSISKYKNILLASLFLSGFGYIFSNTSLQTGMITHGFFIVIILVLLLPEENNNKPELRNI